MAGFRIDGGMLYLGSGLPAVARDAGLEPALVDPTLPVDVRDPDGQEKGLVSPSYSRIAPESRAAYLHWLAGGRSDPEADIGYVFLFFYGLERRLLADARSSAAARAEVPVLVGEVERLRGLYGAHASFRHFSSQLLRAARALHQKGRLYVRPPSEDLSEGEAELDTAAALGQLAVDGTPLPASWALAWVLADPEVRLTKPARRCPDEFRDLFWLRYAERFGSGIRLAPGDEPVRGVIRPASPGFGGELELVIADVPGSAPRPEAARELRELVASCSADLQRYSQLVADDPSARGTPVAAALLPEELGAPAPLSAGVIGDGLDPAHAKLLQAIVSRESWSRAELETLAKPHDLLPDAAVETLNAAAFEVCGEPLLEGRDPIRVNRKALR